VLRVRACQVCPRPEYQAKSVNTQIAKLLTRGIEVQAALTDDSSWTEGRSWRCERSQSDRTGALTGNEAYTGSGIVRHCPE
jgi:hypothetical protein